jgi:hypothetical protein
MGKALCGEQSPQPVRRISVLVNRLWTAMLTRNTFNVDTGTDSSIGISVNTGGQERLNVTFPDTWQDDQEAGVANMYDVGTENRRILTEQLTDSSIRLFINGNDAWRPEHLFVFGEGTDTIKQGATALAIETDVTTQLSTDATEGPSGMPLRLVHQGDTNQTIRRLFILMRSLGSDKPEPDGAVAVPPRSETSGSLQVQIVSQGRLVVLFEIRNTDQFDMKNAQANFYTMPVIVPFTRAQLDAESITFRVISMDNYTPLSLFIFGADRAAGRPTSMVPLVGIGDWDTSGLPTIEPDPTNGVGAITLPLMALPSP